MFHFCVSKVLTVERVTNKTKPCFMQIFVYLISFVCKMFISTTFGDLLAIVIIRSKFGENERLKIRTLLFRNLFQRSDWKKFLSGFNMWLTYNTISWYLKFAKIEYVTAKSSNSLRRPCAVKCILNERDLRWNCLAILRIPMANY